MLFSSLPETTATNSNSATTKIVISIEFTDETILQDKRFSVNEKVRLAVVEVEHKKKINKLNNIILISPRLSC